MAKAIIIKCTIGSLDISNDSIDSLKVERRFSDVSNKFSMSLIDSPVVNTLFTDIELYMCAGGRSISFRYGDDINNLIAFTGTIWDHRVTFVGNIKKLEISGYVTPAKFLQNVSGSTFSYNIDWNSYYNLRADTSKTWNVLRQIDRSNGLAKKYNDFTDKNKSKDFLEEYSSGQFTRYGTYEGSAVGAEQTSDILDDFFHSLYTFNTAFISVRGPVGTIKLPVPTSFVTPNTKIVGSDEDSGTVVDLDRQAVYRYYGAKDVIYKYYSYSDHSWHKVDKDKTDKGGRFYYICPNDDENHIVGFKSAEGTYVEVNLDKKYAGAGTLLYNSNGVSPSDIVRQLAILEGWEIGNIVDTDTVACGDVFKMNNQSALDFITNNLIPVSILPIGIIEGGSDTIHISSGVGGFYPYFKDGKFYYEPLNINNLDYISTISLGYNIPNSPVLSFQIENKGTVFYTTQNIKLNAVNLITGEEHEDVLVSSEAQIKEYNKVSGFNEGLASFFGYSYEEAKSKGFKIDKSGVSSTVKGKYETNPYRTDDEPFDFSSPQLLLNSSYYDDKLASNLVVSAVNSSTEVRGSLESAKHKIEDYMIKASMTLWGDVKLKPASMIKVVNMIKSTDSLYPTQHYTSGTYMIQSQTDEISGSGYIQTLNMYKYTSGLQGGLSELATVDWSKTKILPLTANLNFNEDSNVTEGKLPKGYGLLTGIKYKNHLVYSNGSSKIYVAGLNEYLDLDDLIDSSDSKTQKFVGDLASKGLFASPPKGYEEITPGFYGKGYKKGKYNLDEVTKFYVPFYGGVYMDLQERKYDITISGGFHRVPQIKAPSGYKAYYVNTSNGKYIVEDLYYASDSPHYSEYFFYSGLGILRGPKYY